VSAYQSGRLAADRLDAINRDIDFLAGQFYSEVLTQVLLAGFLCAQPVPDPLYDLCSVALVELYKRAACATVGMPVMLEQLFFTEMLFFAEHALHQRM